MNIVKMLKSMEDRFDKTVSMPSTTFHSIGYHSHLPDGCVCHSTREAIYYALALIKSGKKKYTERAELVIRAVLELQEKNPYHPAYGIWPWFQEEPIDKMAPPDWNWADFIGAAISHILLEHKNAVSQKLRREMTEALERAAWSIFRRNVRPDYTNIALMGAAVTSAAGAILDNPLLVEYARERIKAFWDHTMNAGGLNEYNSPTYTFIALHETERILQLSTDKETVEYAEKLRRYIWETLADHYHPATGQLAGPHSRAYASLLGQTNINFLTAMTGVEIPGYDPEGAADDIAQFAGEKHLPCPKKIAKRFKKLPKKTYLTSQRFIKREPDENSFYGTTYMTDAMTLGSISRSTTWVQTHPLIAYWNNGAEVAVFKFNFLKNGKEFSSIGLRTQQRNAEALTAFYPLTDKGDYHIHLDHPSDQVFKASEFILRYELIAENAELEELSSHVFVLRAGVCQAVLHLPDGTFDGRPTTIACGKSENAVYVDVICYSGPEKAFKFDEKLAAELGGAVEILSASEQVKPDIPEVQASATVVSVQWRGLHVNVPRFGEKFD